MYQLDEAPGRTAIVKGKELLFFSGYSYLGMNKVSAFNDLVKEGIDKYGMIFPSSRVSNTQLFIFNEFERLLSQITDTEETVTFSSGYIAGRAIVNTLANGRTACYMLPDAHPAIDVPNSIRAKTTEDLIREINNSAFEDIILLADAVNPLKSAITDFSFLNSINDNKRITCIIDDSHGIGLIGQNGNGIRAFLPSLLQVEYVLTYSLSKACHINGGAVSCSNGVAAKLRRSPYYSASTPVAPSLAYAFINAQKIYEEQRIELKQKIAKFRELISGVEDVKHHPQLPIFVLLEVLLPEKFEANNIIISSFSYPDPSGYKINRIVLNALHTQSDLEKLAGVLHFI
jgi:7-keto-8-aminopelargonate synthetase-like enzyme